jgi:hypothetical protein
MSDALPVTDALQGPTRPKRLTTRGQRGDGVASSRASGRQGGDPASNGTAEPFRGPRAEVDSAEDVLRLQVLFPFLI